MRHISQLDQTIPKEDQYNIRKRADALLEIWQGLIAASGEAGANASTVNGTDGKFEHSEKPTEKKDDVKKDVPMNGMKAETTSEAPVKPPAEEVAMDTADD